MQKTRETEAIKANAREAKAREAIARVAKATEANTRDAIAREAKAIEDKTRVANSRDTTARDTKINKRQDKSEPCTCGRSCILYFSRARDWFTVAE